MIASSELPGTAAPDQLPATSQVPPAVLVNVVAAICDVPSIDYPTALFRVGRGHWPFPASAARLWRGPGRAASVTITTGFGSDGGSRQDDGRQEMQQRVAQLGGIGGAGHAAGAV